MKNIKFLCDKAGKTQNGGSILEKSFKLSSDCFFLLMDSSFLGELMHIEGEIWSSNRLEPEFQTVEGERFGFTLISIALVLLKFHLRKGSVYVNGRV